MFRAEIEHRQILPVVTKGTRPMEGLNHWSGENLLGLGRRSGTSRLLGFALVDQVLSMLLFLVVASFRRLGDVFAALLFDRHLASHLLLHHLLLRLHHLRLSFLLCLHIASEGTRIDACRSLGRRSNNECAGKK